MLLEDISQRIKMNNKKNIILLHGWGFHSGVWEPFLPLLEKHYHTTCIDLPGFGKTPLPNKTLTLDLLVKNVLSTAPDKAIYLGWSMGGLVATKIAIDHPQRIEKLITISNTPKFLATNDWPGTSPKVLEKFATLLKKDRQTTLEQFATLQFQNSNTDQSVIKQLKALITNTTQPELRALTDGLTILKETDLRNKLKHIQCPQRYLFGQHDTIVPVAVAEKIKDLTHHASIKVIPKTSHAAFLSQPKQCLDLIQEFLIP